MKSSRAITGFKRFSKNLHDFLFLIGPIALIGAIAVAVVLFAARKHQLYKEEIIKEFHRSHIETTASLANSIENGIDEIVGDLEVAGRLIASGQVNASNSIFWNMFDDLRHEILSLAIFNDSGVMISSHPDIARPAGAMPAARELSLSKLGGKRAVLGNFKNASVDTNLKTIEIYIPIFDSYENKTILAAELNLDHLWTRAFRFESADKTGEISIWDDRGNILFHSNSSLKYKNIAQVDEICGNKPSDVCENAYCIDRETIMENLPGLKEGNSGLTINENVRDMMVFYPLEICGSVIGVSYKSSKSHITDSINAETRLTIAVAAGLFLLLVLMALMVTRYYREHFRLREEIRRADDMLASARLNESILASIPSPLAVLGNDFKVAYINRSFAKTFLVSRDQAAGKSLCDILNCRKLPGCTLRDECQKDNSLSCMLNKMLRLNADDFRSQSSAFEIEINRIHAGNDVKSILKIEMGGIESDYKGMPFQILISIIDITDHRRAEQTLKTSEERYRRLYKETPIMMQSIDGEARIVDVNNKWLENLGYSVNEVIGRKFTDFLTEQSRNMASEKYLPQFFTTGSGRDIPYQIIKKNSEIIDVLLSAECEKDKEGNFLHSRTVLIDITERNRFEKALIDSEKFSRAIIENSPIGISVRNHLGKLLSCNKAWKNIWGKSDAEILMIMSEQKKSLNFDNRDDYLGPHLENVKKVYEHGGYCFIPELRLNRNRGDGPHWISQHFYAINSDDGRVEKVVILTVDITDQKRAEQALKQNEDKFRLISEQNLMGIAVLRNDKFEYFNDTYSQILGFSREELAAATINDIAGIIHPEDFAMVYEQYRKKISGDKDYVTRYAYRIINPRGEQKWIEQFSKPIHMEDGLADLVTIIDITDRINAENELKITKFGVDNTAIVILRISSDGKITYANDFACKFLEFEHPRLLEKSLNEIDSFFAREEWEERWLKLKQKGDLLYESSFTTGLGNDIPVGVQMSHFEFDKSEFCYLFAYDFSDRKRTEETLRRLGTAVEQSAEAIVIADQSGNIQYVNPAFEAITGYSRKEAIGQNPKILKSGIHKNDFYETMWQTILSGETWRGRLTNKNKAGLLYEEEMSISPVKDENGKITNFVAVKRDVSRQAALESQLRQSQKLEAIGRLAGGVAHDFNNLLTAINGYSEFVLENIEKDSPIRGDVEEIRKAGERAASLTNQLLAFGRRQIYQPRPLKINDILIDMDKMLRRIIGEDIEYISLLGPSLGLVRADQSHIEQIVMNMVVNSRDAMPDGGKLIIETENIDIGESIMSGQTEIKRGNYVLLTISDSGSGMTKEVQSHIFEPFFTTKEIGRGTGLGLSTVYGIIQQNSGFISLNSEPGSGTTFKIYIPRIPDDSAPPGNIEDARKAIAGSETILLVEDDDVVRNLANTILTRSGFKVLQSSSSHEAPYILKNHKNSVDLLLTDVVMPILNGPKLYHQLKEISPGLKVLYMSGYTDSALIGQGLIESGAEFIQKPFRASLLLEKIRDLLDKKISPMKQPDTI